jgi:hypothetical protein
MRKPGLCGMSNGVRYGIPFSEILSTKKGVSPEKLQEGCAGKNLGQDARR